MKSALYKASLVCSVVNQKNSVLLQLWYVHLIFPCTSLKKYTCSQLACGQLRTLILSTLSCPFHYHYSIMILLIFFVSLVLYERSPFFHKIVMLQHIAPPTEHGFTSNTSTVTVYDGIKMNSR